jgi:glycine/serine hydroxymethyltransferase
MTNKYSEGLPGRRYYGGNEVIDQVEVRSPSPRSSRSSLHASDTALFCANKNRVQDLTNLAHLRTESVHQACA